MYMYAIVIVVVCYCLEDCEKKIRRLLLVAIIVVVWMKKKYLIVIFLKGQEEKKWVGIYHLPCLPSILLHRFDVFHDCEHFFLMALFLFSAKKQFYIHHLLSFRCCCFRCSSRPFLPLLLAVFFGLFVLAFFLLFFCLLLLPFSSLECFFLCCI